MLIEPIRSGSYETKRGLLSFQQRVNRWELERQSLDANAKLMPELTPTNALPLLCRCLMWRSTGASSYPRRCRAVFAFLITGESESDGPQKY